MVREVFATTIITNYHAAAAASDAQQLKLGVSIVNKKKRNASFVSYASMLNQAPFFWCVCPIVRCCCHIAVAVAVATAIVVVISNLLYMQSIYRYRNKL